MKIIENHGFSKRELLSADISAINVGDVVGKDIQAAGILFYTKIDGGEEKRVVAIKDINGDIYGTISETVYNSLSTIIEAGYADGISRDNPLHLLVKSKKSTNNKRTFYYIDIADDVEDGGND